MHVKSLQHTLTNQRRSRTQYADVCGLRSFQLVWKPFLMVVSHRKVPVLMEYVYDSHIHAITDSSYPSAW